MTVNMTETETRYDAPAGLVLPRLDELEQVDRAVVPEQDQLEAEYFDTGDLRLIRAGITLSRRRGGEDEGWHLKLPAGPDSRREVRLPLAHGTGRRVPAELARLVRAFSRGEPLRPVAQMTTRRQRVILLSKSGESLAEVGADDVSARTMGDSTSVSRWQEVEVELTGGDRALLTAADQVLRRDGLRTASHAAKLERAFGLDARPATCRLTPATPAVQVVQAYLRAQADTLTALDPLVRRDEPDAVHKMRVTTRRLRSTLQAFGKIIPRSRADRLAGELKWLGGVLGEARDAQVLSGHLLDGLDQFPVEQVIGPVQARVQGHFAPLRAAARTALLKALDSERYVALLNDLDQFIDEPPPGPDASRPARDVLPAAVRRSYRRTARRMRRTRQAGPGTPTDAGLHQARKAAKRARYAGEAVTPALGKKARRFTRQMKTVQSVLGDHQDTVIARPVARELGIAAHLAGENAFSYGLLCERDAGLARQLRAEARGTWKKASRARYRRWMR